MTQPVNSQPIAGTAPVTPPWRAYFQRIDRLLASGEFTTDGLQAQITIIATKLGSPDGTVENIPGGYLLDSTGVWGDMSVTVTGSLAGGGVSLQLFNDEALPGSNYYYGTGDDGVKGWFNSASNLKIAADPSSTINTVQQTINYMLTPGIVSGCLLSRLDVDTARISAGRILFASADDDGDSNLIFFNVPQVDFDIPADQETRYFAWTYNGGSPLAVMQTVDDFNRDTEIPVGLATRFNGTMVVTPNRYRTSQPTTNVIQRWDALAPIMRDADVGGITLGALATRISTITGGRLWARLEDFPIPDQSSDTEPMVSTYFNGTGLTFTTGLTQWDNANFNNLGTGSLQALGLNKWAVLWFFLAVDGTYGFAYGTGEHNTQGAAANEALPSYLNQDFLRQAYLVGRYVFQRGEDIPTLIEQQLSALTNVSVINDHNSLANLQGGTTGEYYHLTSAQQADVATLSTGGTTGQFWRGDQVYSNTLDGPFTANGNINITGSGRRVLAEMDGGSASNRLTFQDVNTNSISVFQIAPTGTAQFSAYAAFNSSDLENSSTFVAIADATSVQFGSSTTGSGALLPFVITMGGTDALRIDATAHALEAPRAIRETGVVSPAQLTANTDNWAVTGITAAAIIRATTDASRNLTGIASPTAGQMIRLFNVGAFDLVLVHDATSTAANRFLLPNSANLTLNPNDSVSLWYDNTSSRWRALGV